VRALIVDSHEGRGSLAAARALAQAGWIVGVGAPHVFGAIGLSRHVRHRHALPALAAGAEAFVDAIGRIVEDHGYDLVFPSGDGELLALSEHRSRLHGALPYADHQTVLQAIGKRGLMHAAAGVGLSVPRTAASGTEAYERWGRHPLVVKEDRHGTFAPDGVLIHIAPASFDDLAAAEKRVREIRAAGNEPIVQPQIEGRLMAFTSVVDAEGDLLARVQQVSERIYPQSAGLSVRACTVDIDQRLASLARDLLRRLGWLGLSELQFIQPARGEPTVVDFNGRFYGSLSLALAAGVNLPDIWGRMALGCPQTVKDARPGVRYHWLEGDLRIMRSHSTGGSLREAFDCMRYARRSHASIWRISDPLPGIWVALKLIKRATAHLRPRRRAATLR
jgi:predicted ATP-grasp superfamily ATP-dependent carboligase